MTKYIRSTLKGLSGILQLNISSKGQQCIELYKKNFLKHKKMKFSRTKKKPKTLFSEISCMFFVNENLASPMVTILRCPFGSRA